MRLAFSRAFVHFDGALGRGAGLECRRSGESRRAAWELVVPQAGSSCDMSQLYPDVGSV